MRLATLQTTDGPRAVGVQASESEPRFIDLAGMDGSLPRSVRGILAETNGLERAKAAFDRGVTQRAFVTGRLLAPIPDPAKVICIGLNYRDHAAESGKPIPTEPVVFSKFSTAIIGPEAPVRLPAVSTQVDYEAELVVVIGRRVKNIAESEALGAVAGYACGHDVSARDWQVGRSGGQWLLGKTPDTFAPLGPWLVTADEVPDPHNLGIRLRLNGETMQNSSSRELIFRVERLIAHIAQLVTLEPGDVIYTGTPPGVGMARKPPVFLKPGDVVEVEIDGLGVLRNPVEAE
jgi:2-keto-4-pentenoate hydratase/2-oxohepta-3-ene-1,7-dioic acid hydratase in catechol pathway